MLHDYFCTAAEKLIGRADEIQPLHAHSRENEDTPTMTSITISQKEIEEKICNLEVKKKATGPDGVSLCLLEYAGMSIAPSLTSVFKQCWTLRATRSVEKAWISAAFKKGRKQDRT